MLIVVSYIIIKLCNVLSCRTHMQSSQSLQGTGVTTHTSVSSVTLINTAISSNEFSASCSKSTLPLSALYLVDLVKAIWWLISHVAHKKIPFNPINFNFPSTSVGNRDHLFKPQWYDKYQWLEYSTSRDAIFCCPCCYFAHGSDKAEDTFTSIW